jgi:hypothetical protein
LFTRLRFVQSQSRLSFPVSIFNPAVRNWTPVCVCDLAFSCLLLTYPSTTWSRKRSLTAPALFLQAFTFALERRFFDFWPVNPALASTAISLSEVAIDCRAYCQCQDVDSCQNTKQKSSNCLGGTNISTPPSHPRSSIASLVP